MEPNSPTPEDFAAPHGKTGTLATSDGPEASTDDATPSVGGADVPSVGGAAVYCHVAVPIPVEQALTYGLPSALQDVRPGCRVKVPVGRRKLTGMVLRTDVEAPTDFAAKDILEVLDVEPVAPTDLLLLAQFVADYYLAPIGEAARALVPADLPPWGHRRIALTDGGALAVVKDADEGAILGVLMQQRRLRLADLKRQLPSMPQLAQVLRRLQEQGRVTVEEPGRRGRRFVKALELRPGDREEQLQRCGRSVKGRAVVDFLASLGRPATLREIRQAIDCGDGVVRRLTSLQLLREFTQPENRSLARHRLQAEGASTLTLRGDQSVAVDALLGALDAGSYAPFLLAGMTGSGKTEVYLQAVARCLASDRSAILMVPEIALVPALASAVRQRFGQELAILHSNLSPSERLQEWERVRRGEARVVLGPRSALLAPVSRLGLIVVDEEHDTSYKQDVTPRYNGRDLALLRARDHRAVAVLVSATPSLESRHNVASGKLQRLELLRRAGHGQLPEGILVDLRREPGPKRPGEISFSQALRGEIEAAVEAGDQIILLRNRRGYSPLLLCRACGENFLCEDCGLSMTFHKRQHRLVCHYCAHEVQAPMICPQCDEAALEAVGAGTERVEEQFRDLYPGVAVDVLDADAGRRAGGAAAVLERFRSGQTQVLIGTQMVAKGHHFPRVSLAAVLHADSYLGFPDFRAVERTYALLTQLAGRAGRGEQPGKVVIQTFHPDHYAIQAALTGDDRAFIEEEMKFRQSFFYPPFSRMVSFLGRHKEPQKVHQAMQELARRVRRHPLAAKARITGPAAAPLERLRGKWRFQLLVRSAAGSQLRQMARQVQEPNLGIELTVDVDPYDLM